MHLVWYVTFYDYSLRLIYLIYKFLRLPLRLCLGLSHQLRNRAKERERERRRSSGANLPSGMVPRVVRRNESISERTLNEIENRE